MSFCSAAAIEPGDVTPATLEQFREALSNDSIVPNPKQLYRTTCVIWNQASVEIAAWPKLVVPVPDGSRRYALQWTDFPPSFQSDAEKFLTRSANQDPFAKDYAPSIRDSTVAMRRKQILQIGTALVLAGFPTGQIVSLATLTEPDNAKRALRFFLDRSGGKTKYLHQQAILLKTIARHWAEAPDEQVEIVAGFASNLRVKQTGMTDKNRARLRQFDNIENVLALANLAPRVFHEVEQADDGHRRTALRVMLAVAVEVLLVAPMRIDNLAGLDLDRHLVQVQIGRSTTTHIVIPAAETKNKRPFELELPEITRRLISIYRQTYRARIAPAESCWLFPNETARRRSTVPFAQSIAAFIERETGIKMNVHLFRHLSAKLQLERHPADIETVRRVLGHSSTVTTLRAYADLRTKGAFDRYGAIISSLRQYDTEPSRREPRKPSDT